jgi:hypothetical protein
LIEVGAIGAVNTVLLLLLLLLIGVVLLSSWSFQLSTSHQASGNKLGSLLGELKLRHRRRYGVVRYGSGSRSRKSRIIITGFRVIIAVAVSQTRFVCHPNTRRIIKLPLVFNTGSVALFHGRKSTTVSHPWKMYYQQIACQKTP